MELVAETVKKTAFKITRMGQLVAKEASRRLGVPYGINGLVARADTGGRRQCGIYIRRNGLGKCGAHGTTAALAL